MSNWIKDIETEKISKEIGELTKNIENNNMKLGKYLYELNNVSKIDYSKLSINETKGKQLIKNYLFFEEYKLKEDIGYTKLTMLTKVKEKHRLNQIIEYSYKSTIEELKNFIFNNNVQNFTSKNILLDEEDVLNFDISKKIAEKITGTTLNNSQIFKFLMMDFINNNSEMLEENDLIDI